MKGSSASRAFRESDHEKAANEAEVLEELPHLLAPFALAGCTEVVIRPELMVADCRNGAEPGQDRCCRPVEFAGDDAERCHRFDDGPDIDQ